jgi:DNA polymerase (family 10)
MSVNKKVAAAFDLLAKLMELHNENIFKIRSYSNAHLTLRKVEKNLTEMSLDELAEIKGVGTAIAAKIVEYHNSGTMNILEVYKHKTPPGIQELLTVKGLGPKKVAQIWHELEITTPGELLYACNENRVAGLRGFGLKAQDDLIRKLEYHMESRGKMLYAHVEKVADACVSVLQQAHPGAIFSLTGDIRRKFPEVHGIDILTDLAPEVDIQGTQGFEVSDSGCLYQGIPVFFRYTNTSRFQRTLFEQSCSEAFLDVFEEKDLNNGSETEIFKSKGTAFVPPECRESQHAISLFRNGCPKLVEDTDIKGIIHAHTTYSDGIHSLEEMAAFTKSAGYQYLVITDHSKSAGYAGGLSEDRVLEQGREIDQLNKQLGPDFRIFKGIESDILSEGALDYDDSFLQHFEVVIASIHSGMQMSEEKATSRLIRAIEHPATRILGHPTGRLLLARPGYPVNHQKIIDACAANNVAIELNANPQRLDIDWKWIQYAVEKGVLIAINPDAHSRESIHFVHYGVLVARKGLLTAEMCLNTMDRETFLSWLKRS